MFPTRLVIVSLVFGLTPLSGVGHSPQTTDTIKALPVPKNETGEATVSFNRDIAPILFDHCAVCHRPGEAAPFSVLTYQEVNERAGLIAAFTEARMMPPWLPEKGDLRFLGERGLTDEEISLIGEWVAQGAVEGDPADLPPAPTFAKGWKLGQPDLVVKLDQPYLLKGGKGKGVDQYRNLVMPIPVSKARWVKAVELRPGNKRVVHHAVLRIDRSLGSRRRDKEDSELGFEGMDMSTSHSPGGQLIGWTPGKVPVVDERLAWRLEPGTDFVLQLHLLPSGESEEVHPEIGLYFSDQAPTLKAFTFAMRNDDIDIAPGVESHVIQEQVTLPVSVSIVGIYPHAHYLAKKMEVFAKLPDGNTRWLLRIPKWDFNWQDDYRYVEPIPLPTGATLTMRYTYDNSVNNPSNPNDPPKRVRYGNRSQDEMATLGLQMVTSTDEDRHLLREALMRVRVERNANNWPAHDRLGSALQAQGKLDEAIIHFKQAIRLSPGNPRPLYKLGNALLEEGKVDAAIDHYRKVLAIDPNHTEAHNNLAAALSQNGDLDGAVDNYQRQLALTPRNPQVHANLGNVLLLNGELDQADASFDLALTFDREWLPALEGKGDVARARNQLSQAGDYYRKALALYPDSSTAHYRMGLARLGQGDWDRATSHLRHAIVSNPDYLGALNNQAWTWATHPDAKMRAPDKAVVAAELVNELSGGNVPALLDTLGAALAANGRFAQASGAMEQALRLLDASDASREDFRARLTLYQRGQPYIEK